MPNGTRQDPAHVPDENEEFLAGILDEQESPKPQPKPARKPASRPAAAETQDDDQQRPAPKPAHSRESLELAAYFGLDDVDVAGMTPDQLNAKVTALSRREFARLHGQRQAPANPAPQPAEVRTPQEAEDQWGKLIGDPEQARFFREKDQATQRELADLKKQLAERTETDKQRAISQRDERLDDGFAMLPDGLRQYYGDATGQELAESGNTTALRRRAAILAAAGVDLSKPLPAARALSRRLEAAHGMLHPEPERPAEEEEVESPYSAAAREPVKPANRGHQNVRGDKGRYAGPAPRITQRDWEGNGPLLRPSARNGRSQESDGEHSGFAAPGEFDLE